MNSTTKALVPLLAICLLTTDALADYQSGVAAYTRGDFERALLEWQKVIESPVVAVHPFERAETFYAVAMLFWMGQGVTQDTSTSAGFLRQAAELNHAGAQSKLGYLSLIGQGVPANTFEAMKWLQMAAKQGDTDAQYNLAVMYRDGMGVGADPELAMQWFREAAANGDPVSAEVLAAYQRQGSLQSVVEPEQPVSAKQVRDERQSNTDSNTDSNIDSSTNSNTDSSTVTSAEIVLQPKAELATGPVLEPVSEPVFGPEMAVKEPELEVNASSPATHEPSVPGVLNEQWILSRSPDHYTIQVIALKNLRSMNSLIAQHPELQPFALYVQGEPDSPLYVLLQGDYADLDEVRVVQNDFPRSLARPNQTWVRRFNRVQELIESRRQNYGGSTEISRAKD